MKTVFPTFTAALMIGTCVSALAQAPGPGASPQQANTAPLPPTANVVGLSLIHI